MPTTSASVRAAARPSGVVTSASTAARSAVASWASRMASVRDQLAEFRRRRPDVPEPRRSCAARWDGGKRRPSLRVTPRVGSTATAVDPAGSVGPRLGSRTSYTSGDREEDFSRFFRRVQ